MEICSGQRGIHSIDLVRHQHYRLVGFAQFLRDRFIRYIQPGFGIHDEKNQIRFLDRVTHLAACKTRNAAFLFGKTSGIHHQAISSTTLDAPVLAISGEPRGIRD